MTSLHLLPRRLQQEAGQLADTLQHWPWLGTLRILRERFRGDRLGLTASSLTFTTLIALVPLMTVGLAVFAAFPMFGSFRAALERYFLQALVPTTIARPVLEALTQFAEQATRLGSVGLVVLAATALALMSTIDRALNAIWRVRRPRPFGQRVLVYWAALTLGPLALGVSLSISSYAISASRGLVGTVPGGVGLLLGLFEFLLLLAVLAGLFHYVPNTHVRWRHALAGGLFAALGIEAAKKVLTWYVASVPTYSTVYGAFATLPILLLWLYMAWGIVLLGAVLAAYAPSLGMHLQRHELLPGHRFALALAVLRALAQARHGGQGGHAVQPLAEQLQADPLLIESVMATLTELGWAGRLEDDTATAPRHVLLIDPASAPARPLLEALLLGADPKTAAFRERAGFERLRLAELL